MHFNVIQKTLRQKLPAFVVTFVVVISSNTKYFAYEPDGRPGCLVNDRSGRVIAGVYT